MTATATTACPSCQTILPSDAAFCDGCGEYLVDEFDEALAEFQPKADAAALWLGALALLTFLAAGLIFATGQRAAASAGWLNVGLGMAYLGLCAWALRDAYAAAAVALGLWLTVQVANFVIDPSSLGSGIVLKVIVFIGLMKAMQAGQMVRVFRAQRS